GDAVIGELRSGFQVGAGGEQFLPSQNAGRRELPHGDVVVAAGQAVVVDDEAVAGVVDGHVVTGGGSGRAGEDLESVLQLAAGGETLDVEIVGGCDMGVLLQVGDGKAAVGGHVDARVELRAIGTGGDADRGTRGVPGGVEAVGQDVVAADGVCDYEGPRIAHSYVGRTFDGERVRHAFRGDQAAGVVE